MDKKSKVIDLFGKKNVIPNTVGVSYSKLIEQFLVPFQKDFPEDFYLEEIFEFAINAWNFGNMKLLLPKEDFEKSMDLAAKEDNYYQLLRKMIDYKATHFKAFTNFIQDYEITEKNGEDTLSVISQAEEDYLSEMMDSFDNEYAPNDFEENYINRQAIVLKPLQPFVDWLSNLYPIDEVPEFNESNIYLVNDEIDNLDLWLKKKFDKFFMLELEELHPNKKEWPQKRNYKMFREWFHIEISSLIYDLEKQPIIKS